METWLEQLLSTLTTTGWYYLAIAAIAAAEGIALVGLVIPGSVLCISVGSLAATGHGDILWTCSAAALGSIIGDALSYVLGARLGSLLIHSCFPQRSKPLLSRAELYFSAHGGKSLIAARFFGPLRGLVPFVAGGVHFPPAAMALYTTAAGIVWGILYPGLGYLGVKSWQQWAILRDPQLWLLAGLGIILALLVYYRRKKSPHGSNQNRR